MSPFTRRSLLHAAAAVGAARALPSFAAPAATPKKAIAIVLFRGGLNALHASPLSLQGHFSTSPDSMIATGTGLMVDKSTFGALPATALTRMAVVGVDHGYTAHDPAEAAMFSAASSYPLTLAAAMSAEAALRCAIVGESPAFANFAPVPGASITTIKDVRSALDVLVGSSRAEEPPRAAMLRGLKRSYGLSRTMIEQNPRTLAANASGYETIVSALASPVRVIDWSAIVAAYGLPAGTTEVSSNAARFAAAELAIQGGTPVVIIPVTPDARCGEAGWDTHGDTSGECARNMFSALAAPHLGTFLERTLAMTGTEVTTVVMGEFSRDPFLSDHARCLAAAVFGPRVKPGSTGAAFERDGKLVMPDGTPGIAQFWALLAELGGAASNPFGSNAHAALVQRA